MALSVRRCVIVAALLLPIGSGLELQLRAPPDASISRMRAATQVWADQEVGFTPTQGGVGMMAATRAGSVCDRTYYQPSELETTSKANVLNLTSDRKKLCEHMKGPNEWIRQLHSSEPPGPMFSKMCIKGRPPQFIEPLAGMLRDPRFLCSALPREFEIFSIEWLLLGDTSVLQKKTGKKILFDAGGTRFRDAMNFFTRAYEKRGIVFDEIYVWEAKETKKDAYWKDIPEEVQKVWKPRLTYYNGVPVTAEPGHKDNPVDRIFAKCKPEDFCAFKLDIDTPSVELPIVQQLVSSPKTGAHLDEFFFEHHVTSTLSKKYLWVGQTNGTFADSYDIFTRLREKGVRAHSWI